MSKPEMTFEPTWVYHVCCEHGGLLYVGIAADLNQRLKQHRATKEWWHEVNYVAATLYPDRTAARNIERQHIWEGRPKHNSQDKKPTNNSPYRGVLYGVDSDGDWSVLDVREADADIEYHGADA